MAAPEITIPVNDDDGLDSAYGEGDEASETHSLLSAVTNYVYENGRRYQSYRSASYWGPNDEKAQDNLDITHHIFRLSLDGELFLAPIGKTPQRVLDLGTGTGIWAIEFADQFPSASVIGTDLSPIQPSEVPPNLQFEVDDFCSEWLFTKESFDFIHARSIYGCVADYAALYGEVYKHLKPGGWFEQAEMSVDPQSEDGSIRGTPLESWGPLGLEAGDRFGKSLRIVHETKERMEAAGFVNVTYEKFKWPIGPWSKDKKMRKIGLYNRLTWEEGMEGWAMFLFTKHLGWRPEEVLVFCAQTRSALRDKTIHAFQDMSVCYGRKPPRDSDATQL